MTRSPIELSWTAKKYFFATFLKGTKKNSFQPSEASKWWIPGIHEPQQIRKTRWPLGSLKGGSETPEAAVEKPPSEFDFSRRPDDWLKEVIESNVQRPLPLEEPRNPDLEFADETADGIEREGGVQLSSIAKDVYRRTPLQKRAIKEARRDQRSVGGGIYQCLQADKRDHYLTIHKAFLAPKIAIELEIVKSKKEKRLIFQSFYNMNYEQVELRKSSGQRYRKSRPEETHTGFKWSGHGGEQWPLQERSGQVILPSCVYMVQERSGDRDLHFSGKECGRITERPGASQGLCSSNDCGVVVWHFERKRFDKRCSEPHYKEEWVDDFSIVVFKDDTMKLVWRDESGVITFWEKTESSAKYSTFKPLAAAEKRVESIMKEGAIPPHVFTDPIFVPLPGPWRVQRPLKRVAENSKW